MSGRRRSASRTVPLRVASLGDARGHISFPELYRAAGDFLEQRNIVGASLTWAHGDLSATLYGYNLTNDHYVAALLSPIRIAGPPRQFGVSFMKSF